MDLPAKKVHRPVYATAIAPTLSLFIGAKPPTGSMGESLVEVLNGN
jgi:hypothetical protein